MHRVRFCDPGGSIRDGEWTDDGVAFAGRTYDRDAVEILPPSDPSKIVGVGLNYADHAAEMDLDVPERPSLFVQAPNALAAHGSTVTLPDRERVEHEAELGVVIGDQCRDAAGEAMEYVAGYTAVNDISNRTDQFAPEGGHRDLFRGKAFDNAAPVGPAMATPDEVPDDARIALRVNGEVRQDSSLSELLFSVPELVAEITEYVTLEPGDVISTGTPPGVGPLDGGDSVEVDIEGIPTLRHDVGEP